ncbi:MAG: ABC transporter permease [Bacteroidota bacterium]
MFKHYLKISLRTLIKDKGYSFINIGGLALGMLVVILISLWIFDEITFNQYHQNYENIAIIKRQQSRSNGERFTSDHQTTALGNLLRENYKDYFKHLVMSRRAEDHILSTENRNFTQKGNFMQADGPEMLSLKILSGDREGLDEKNTILLSASLANKLFGDHHPIDRVLRLDDKTEVKVTGVFEDLPRNSEFWETTFIAPLDLYFTMTGQNANTWDNSNMQIYAQIHSNTNFAAVSATIEKELSNHMSEEDAKVSQAALFLHPMKKWHLFNEFENGVNVTSNRLRFVWFYGIIGFIVLLLACINFVNLSTARSEKRAKEIGVRKSIGSDRAQIVRQFLNESVVIAIIAFSIAILATLLLLPWFNELAGKDIQLPFWQLGFWVTGLGFTLFTGLLAGSYPALYLSSFKAVRALKGTFREGKFAVVPRKVLVVFQFAVSMVLIMGTIVVYQQIQHAKNRTIGYDRDHLIMIPKQTPEFFEKSEVLLSKLNNTTAVSAVGESNYPLTNTSGNNNGFSWEGKPEDFDPILNTIFVNYDYGKTIGWEMIEGRDFSKEFPSDRLGLVITESTQKLMGLKDPIGMQLKYEPYEGYSFTILGVVKDMIKGDPFENPMPAVMFVTNQSLDWMFMRLNPQLETREALAQIEDVFSEVIPSTPFDYQFLDEEYNAKFKAEERTGELATFLAIIAILISCLGLLGLVAYVTEKRAKEIGIRKVLGANTSSIVGLLSKDFLKLVLIGFVVATPLAWYFMQQWLDNFVYRIDIHWSIFFLVGFVGIGIALLTVSFQSLKAAFASPIQSLKNE